MVIGSIPLSAADDNLNACEESWDVVSGRYKVIMANGQVNINNK